MDPSYLYNNVSNSNQCDPALGVTSCEPCDVPLSLLQPVGGPLIAAWKSCRWSVSRLVLVIWPNCLRRLSPMISDTGLGCSQFESVSHYCWLLWTRAEYL